MRLLLICAPILSMQEHIHRTELLGIEYLAAACRKAGHDVEVWDTSLRSGTKIRDGVYLLGASNDEVDGRIRASRPDVVGISCHYGFSASYAYEIARQVKKISSQIITVIGGLHVSVQKEAILEACPEIDFAITGEAEHSFVELLGTFEAPSPKQLEIDGLAYRNSSEVFCNEKQAFIDELDALPFPARDLVQIDEYMAGSYDYQLYGLGFEPALSILTSRSCPMRCTYCNMKIVHGRKWRPRSADGCIAELDEIVNRWGAKHIFFVDDYFTLKIDRAKEICEGIIKSGLRIRWNTPNGISVKNIDRELAELMRRSGCANVCVAIESGSEEVRRKLMDKPIKNNDIIKAVTIFRDVGIPVVGFVMIGMPGETADQIRESIAFVKNLPLTSVVVSFVVPFRGTRLYDILAQRGGRVPDGSATLDDYKHPVLIPEGVTSEQLVEWKSELRSAFPSLGILRRIEQETQGALALQ